MARTPSHIPGYTSTHSDGAPGLEYFQDDHAFAWTGRAEDLIEVSPGAYGEPVEWVIPVAPLLADHSGMTIDLQVPSLLAYFRHACDQWLAWRQRCTQPNAAHRPGWSHALKCEVCEVCLVPATDIPRDVLVTHGNHLPAQWEDCLGA